MRIPNVSSVRLPGNRRLTVRAWDGVGEPLVLLHGLLDCSEGWESLVQRTTRPCLAIDLPGFGGSDLPEHARIDSYARDIASALERLAIRDCTLVGHSLGGAIAAAVADTSDRVAGLVLLAPAGFGRIGLAEALTKPVIVDIATLALPLALVNPLTVTAAYSTFVARRRLPERDLITRLRRRAARAPLAVRAATIAIAKAGRDEPRGGSFAGPVAALWGTHDALVPTTHAGRLREAIPRADVEFWAGMGHHPQRERPQALAHFVERTAAAASAHRAAAAAARVA
jgi:pyruvate dehydrogenase E2 component (dihydrolipoamide acetyltransferase)